MNQIDRQNKKLLIVTTIPDTIESFLIPFIRYFRALGWRVDSMAQGINQASLCQAECNRVWEVEWSRNPLDPKNLLVAAPKVREVVEREHYDLVHVHTPVAAFVTRYALRNRRDRLQVFYTAHGFHFHSQGNYLKNAIFLALEKLAGGWTDYLITINREDETAAQENRLLPPEKIYYTPGIGVDLQYYNCDRVSTVEIATLREELKLASTDSLLLCIAEFIPRKRHCDLLQALHQLNRPDIHLALAGSGSLQLEIERLTLKLNLERQIHFLGFRSDIPQLLGASKGLLLTSQQEGLPRSIMEALAMGIPVIGTRIRGIEDLLKNDCGLLIEVGDLDALAQAMVWIVDCPHEAQKMGQRGQEKIAQYEISKAIDVYHSLYERAFEEREIKSIIAE